MGAPDELTPRYDLSLLAGVGTNVFVSAAVEIRRPKLVTLGSHIAIDSGFYVTTRATLGDHIHIGPYVKVIGGARALLTMGHFTNLAAGATVLCASDEYGGDGLVTAPGIPRDLCDTIDDRPVVLRDFAAVGAHAVVMPGVELAEGSVVGACALVTHSTEPWTIYTGVPARAARARPRERLLEHAAKLGYRR